MEKPPALSKIIKGPKDHKGRPRKMLEIKSNWYDDYDFGQEVVITPVDAKPKQKADQES